MLPKGNVESNKVLLRSLVSACGAVDASWWPPGLYGARRGRSAAMAANMACLLLEDAKLGNVRARHVLALDQAKCFDRLLCPAIAELVRQAGLPDVFLVPLRHYANLRRTLFIDGCITPFVIHGINSCGIPQGCPLSAFYCNLVAAAWERQVLRAGPQLSAFTYLDDRPSIGDDALQFESALQASDDLDKALGPALNMDNCQRALAGGRADVLSRVGPLLQRFTVAPVLKYMGIDIGVRGRALPVAKERVKCVHRKCQAVLQLPSVVRSDLAGDAVIALWLQGGTALSEQV